jgi:predicted nucleic acid-binding protein
MKGLFLDTNVIIDVLANRKPYVDSSSKLFDLAVKGKVTLYVSALSYSNIYYIIRKHATHRQLLAILKDLENMTETLDVTKEIVVRSIQSGFKDFEDAIQYETAKSTKKVDAIITLDPRGFKASELTVLTPDEAITILISASS